MSNLTYDERRLRKREIREKHERWQGSVVIALIILGVAFPIAAHFVIAVPVGATYNRLFRSNAIMLDDMATFEGMQTQLNKLQRVTESAFVGLDPNETFDTPWYWDFTYDHSLQAQYDYYNQLNVRFDEAILEKNQILTGEKVILSPYAQWYQETLESLRDEIRREGGILWVTKNAWFLYNHPIAYWLITIDATLGLLLFLVGVYVVSRKEDYGDLE